MTAMHLHINGSSYVGCLQTKPSPQEQHEMSGHWMGWADRPVNVLEDRERVLRFLSADHGDGSVPAHFPGDSNHQDTTLRRDVIPTLVLVIW